MQVNIFLRRPAAGHPVTLGARRNLEICVADHARDGELFRRLFGEDHAHAGTVFLHLARDLRVMDFEPDLRTGGNFDADTVFSQGAIRPRRETGERRHNWFLAASVTPNSQTPTPGYAAV